MGQTSDFSPGYLANNAPRLISYSLYGLFNLALFLYATAKYDGSGLLVQTARGCGAIINFNAAFCLLPMMRLLISAIRRTRISRYLALEDSIGFHRVSGHVIVSAALLHTIVYVVLYSTTPERSLIENLGATLAALTGCLLVLLFVVMWLFALERSRKHFPYEAFLTAHALAIPIAIALLLHSPNYWKWFLVGGTGYLADRAVRFWRMRRPSRLASARALPSQVTELAVERPPGWTFRAGDFVWLLIPSISRLEWHPFTISSPPEREGTFTVHIRTVGDWTMQVRRRLDRLEDVPVFFDGPHGAPANDIFNARVAVLVAAGIGVTPFASILQSLLARDNPQPTRIYFYWINRDHRAFEWFTDMVAALKRDDLRDRFDIQLFVTDPPADLPPLTKVGRPDWAVELRKIADAHPAHHVGLFYCGPRGLSQALHSQCKRIGWAFKEEHF